MPCDAAAGLIHDVPHLDIRHEQQIRLPGHGVADRLVAGGLARERAVDRERPGDDAARNPAPRHLARRHGRGHLLRHGFDRGQNRHLRRLDPQRVRHRQRVLDDPDLRLDIGVNVDRRVGDQNDPPVVLEKAALAQQPPPGLRHQTHLAI